MISLAIITLILTFVLQAYLCRELMLYIKATKLKKVIKFIPFIFVLLNLPTLLIFLNRVIKIQFPSAIISNLILYSFSIWQGATIFFFLFLIIGKSMYSLTKFATNKFTKDKPQKSFDHSRRKFINTLLIGTSTYAFASSTFGTITRNNFKIEKVKIKIRELPDELNKLTIGLISDIHSGVFMSKEDMKQYLEALNTLEPDLIFLPGDFITSDFDEIFPFIEIFKDLKAKYGVFATLGNHEFFTKQASRIAKVIEENGIRVLRNESEELEVNGKKFFIVGIDDLRYGADLDKATKHIKPEKFKILLSHKPYAFMEFARKNIQLTLSGHTHGGQIVFAKIDDIYITPASLVSKLVSGHYKIGDSHLYITRGVGTVGLPIRLNCPPEITYITLVSG